MATKGWRAGRETRAKTAKPDDGIWATNGRQARSASHSLQEHDLTPQIAKRAYELYELRGRQSGQTDQDWLQAEREIKLEAKR